VVLTKPIRMSTSGVALTLALVPYRFPGLSYIGLTLFLLDVAFFILISTAILARFVLYRPTFRRAFTRPSEALFVPTLFLSIAAMLSNAAEYARIFLPASQVERLARGFLRPAFWVYLGLSFMCSVLQYHLLFTVKKPARRLRVDAMTPAWILPVFPVMLAGTLAPACARNLADARQSVAILAAGLAAQGLGWAVSGFMYATYLSRLMVFGLPVQRPGMFIAVGPPSFTCSALVTMAGEVPRVLVGLAGLAAEEVNQGGRTLSVWAVAAGLGEADIRTLAAGVQMLATCTAVFLWGLSFWFFATATAAVVAGMPDRAFHLSWWSFVFPNVGLTLASLRLGQVLGSEGMMWFSTVMAAVLFLAWLFIFFRCIRAVYKREIVWPGHDEDSD
jgi:tellurite resistance protein TehA-like permease